MEFEWDENKNQENQIKHQVSFEQAQFAFNDMNRIISKDDKHSDGEERLYCIGFDGVGICTVRYTIRDNKIRIIGAGYWRKGRKIYNEKNS